MGPSRSVVDFDTEDALRKALMAVKLPGDSGAAQANDGGEGGDAAAADAAAEQPSNGCNGVAPMEAENMDWVLPSFDAETTEAQSMKEELHRLQVLKSYLILDAEPEEHFDRLTRLAARLFDVPIALVSLVDLGRQWFLSNRGLGDVRETPRKLAFCAHTILNKHNILIVPDATKDFRFRDHPMVVGSHIRFYAGAPLVSPEGYKLGTFCIIDYKTRPAGLSQEDQASLRDFADMTVKEMVERRGNLKEQQNPAQLIAYTAHDLMTPLTGVQLSLSLLKGDDEVKEKLGGHQQELLSTAASCSDLMIRICQTAIDTLRDESSVPDVVSTNAKGSTPVTKMSELMKSLAMIMEPIPKRAPLIIMLAADVPPTIMSDDLKLFRSSLNLISNAVGRTNVGLVHLQIFLRYEGDKQKVVFECTDTGDEIPAEEYPHLFQPNRTADGEMKLGLSSVATLINSLDGEYGFRPLPEPEEDDDMKPSANQPPAAIIREKRQGALFWFSVPLYTPESFGVAEDEELPLTVIRKIASTTSVRKETATLKQPIIPIPKNGSGTISATSVPFIDRNGSLQNGLGAAAQNSSASSVLSIGRRRVPGGFGGSTQAEMSNLRNFLEPGEDSKIPAVPVSVSVSGAPPPAAKSAGRKRHALIIEDSVVVRKSLARALEKQGLTVTQAVNGLEGLKSMKAKIFDFVLCDFLMPVMDGLDCVKQYRDWEKQHRPDVRQFIAGISAHAGANDGNKGIMAGMNVFHPKPVTIKILTEINQSTDVAELSKQLDEIEQIFSLGHDSGSNASSAASLSNLDQSTSKRSSSALPLTRPGSGNSFGLGKGGPMPGINPFKRSPVAVGSLASQQNSTFDLPQPDNKRRKVNVHGLALACDPGVPVCLMARDTNNHQSCQILTKLQQEGWRVIGVDNGREALRHMKTRNWNAVLVDDDIPMLSAFDCITEFRVWEQQNRVNRQRNVFVVCNAQIPSMTDERSVVQPPTGYDGVLGKPVQFSEMNRLMGMKRERSLDIIVGGQLM